MGCKKAILKATTQMSLEAARSYKYLQEAEWARDEAIDEVERRADEHGDSQRRLIIVRTMAARHGIDLDRVEAAIAKGRRLCDDES